MMVVNQCVCCPDGTSFTDLPPGSASRRWVGKQDIPMTKCDACGAWYPQSSIDPDVRKEA